MFSKLLKHEWKASAGMLGVLSLAALGLGVLGTVLLRIMVSHGDQMDQSTPGYAMAMMGMSSLLGFIFLALVIYAVASQYILLYRFYKNKFTDEGYLTFTLPVNSHQLFLTSWLNMLAWMLISAVVVFASFAMALIIGTATTGLINQDVMKGFEVGFKAFIDVFALLYGNQEGTLVTLGIILILVQWITGPIILMTAVTMGAVIAKKHKILAAFGVYYAISAVLGVVSSMFSVFGVFLDVFMSGGEPSLLGTTVVQILTYVAVAVVGYFWSTYLMKNKLNLP